MYERKFSKGSLMPTLSRVKSIDTIQRELMQAMGERPINQQSSNVDSQQQSRPNKQKKESQTNSSKKLRQENEIKLKHLNDYLRKKQTEKTSHYQYFNSKNISMTEKKAENKNDMKQTNGNQISRRQYKYVSPRVEPTTSNLQVGIQEQEKLFKKIQQKAMMLKKKERKQRDMLKHFKKTKVVDVSLSQVVQRSQSNLSEDSRKRIQLQMSTKDNQGQPAQEGQNQIDEKYQNLEKQYEELEEKYNKMIDQQQQISSKEQQVKTLTQRLQSIVKSSQIQKANYSTILSQFQLREKQLLLKLEHYEHNHKQQNQQSNKQYQIKIQHLNTELTKTKDQFSKINLNLQEKEKIISTTREYLVHAEQHISRVQTKYHEVNKELTEKNVAYDFLWMQLQQQKKSITNLQRQLSQYKNSSLEKKSITRLNLQKQNSEDHQISNKQSSKRNHMNQIKKLVLSSSTIKELQIQIGGKKQSSRNKIAGDQHQILSNSLLQNLNQSRDSAINMFQEERGQQHQNIQITEEYKQQEQQKQRPIKQIGSKRKLNIMLQPNMSDAFSQSEYNDQIQDLVSNKNSNTSKMESSLGAFSEYSRIKSTQSEMNKREVQKAYKDKLKNTKLLAKLNKLKKK